MIKVWTSGGTMSERDSLEDQHFSDEELLTIVAEAHRLRRRVASHAEGLFGARASIAAGVDSIEHGFDLDDQACAEMRQRGTFLVATLLLDRVVHTPGVPEYARAKARPMFETHLRSFRLALETGVRIASGSDAFSDPVTAFGPYNLREIELRVGAGMTPEIGTIEEGKQADLLVVRGDLAGSNEPLTRRANLVLILQGGRPAPRLEGVLRA